ncbi:MAG: glycosyltransferase family 2 protein [Methanosarcinaceae archaeon]
MQSVELSSPLISVVICTYNRLDIFVDALKSICNQTLDASFYEVIVVDNNSSDNTAHVAKDFCERFSNVSYCLESKQGLSHARNRGWREAKGEYVAYIDDDCKVPEQWLTVAKDIIERFSPGVFGGPAYAFYNAPKPYWFKDSYGAHEPFKDARILKNKECIEIFGMNMCFRRALLGTIGGFDIRLGMCGEKIAYCEETALILHIFNTMPDELIYYDPKLYVYHLVQEERMTVRWLVRSWFSIGQYSNYCSDVALTESKLQLYGRLHLLKQIARQLIVIAKNIAYSAFRRNRMRYAYFQNYLYECTYQHLFKLGKLYGEYQYMRGRR